MTRQEYETVAYCLGDTKANAQTENVQRRLELEFELDDRKGFNRKEFRAFVDRIENERKG